MAKPKTTKVELPPDWLLDEGGLEPTTFVLKEDVFLGWESHGETTSVLWSKGSVIKILGALPEKE